MTPLYLRSVLDRYDPENDYAPISQADALLLEAVIELMDQVAELRQQISAMTQHDDDTPPHERVEWGAGPDFCGISGVAFDDCEGYLHECVWHCGQCKLTSDECECYAVEVQP